jgi:GT2 family glycosyltransferase
LTSIDIVVCDYHTPQLLADFITSYNTHHYEGCTLTVADVEPTELRARDLAQEHQLNYLAFNRNVGYGRACNEAVYHAGGTGEVILLANSDTRLTAGLAECADVLMAHGDWGALGPRQVNEHNQIVHAGIVGLEIKPYPRAWLEPDMGQHSYIDETTLSVSGSLYFVKRKLWEEMANCELYQAWQPGVNGAFLETPHYFEETFCSYHLRAHGYKVVYYGPVAMTHLWHRASTLGGDADRSMPMSRAMHRNACSVHSIVSE